MYYIVTTRATDYPYSIVETPDGLAVEADADCNHPTAQFATMKNAHVALDDALNMLFHDGDDLLADPSMWQIISIGERPCTA